MRLFRGSVWSQICSRPVVVCCWHCWSLHVGNQLLVLCWSWCDAMPVRKRKKTLALRRFLLLYFSSLLIYFLHSHFFSLWALPGKFLFQKRGPLCNFSFVCGSLIKTDYRVLTRIIFMFICQRFLQFPDDTVLDHCLLCRCESVLWVHVSPMLHP